MLQILELSGIPIRSAARGPSHPLISMGGVCAWSNPEPLAAFVDWFFLGEGEESGQEAFELWGRVREGGAIPVPLGRPFSGACSGCRASTSRASTR